MILKDPEPWDRCQVHVRWFCKAREHRAELRTSTSQNRQNPTGPLSLLCCICFVVLCERRTLRDDRILSESNVGLSVERLLNVIFKGPLLTRVVNKSKYSIVYEQKHTHILWSACKRMGLVVWVQNWIGVRLLLTFKAITSNWPFNFHLTWQIFLQL